MHIRELTEAEKQTYDEMVKGAKQINIFGVEEELDAKDYVFGQQKEEKHEISFEL